jgi:hypothetical protein
VGSIKGKGEHRKRKRETVLNKCFYLPLEKLSMYTGKRHSGIPVILI